MDAGWRLDNKRLFGSFCPNLHRMDFLTQVLQRLDSAVMHVSCIQAGTLLARLGRPEVSNCVAALEQYGAAYEEVGEQAVEMKRIFASARSGDFDFNHMASVAPKSDVAFVDNSHAMNVDSPCTADDANIVSANAISFWIALMNPGSLGILPLWIPLLIRFMQDETSYACHPSSFSACPFAWTINCALFIFVCGTKDCYCCLSCTRVASWTVGSDRLGHWSSFF